MIKKYLTLNIYTRVGGFFIDLIFLWFSTVSQQQIFYTQTWVLLILGSIFGTFLNACLISGSVNTIIFSILYLLFGVVVYSLLGEQLYFLYFLFSSFVVFSLRKKVITNDQIIRNSFVQSCQNTIILLAIFLMILEFIDFGIFINVLSIVILFRCMAFYIICMDCVEAKSMKFAKLNTFSHVLAIFRPVIINSIRFVVSDNQMGLAAVAGKVLNSLYIFLVTPLIMRRKFVYLTLFWIVMIFLTLTIFMVFRLNTNIMLLFLIFMLAEIAYIAIHRK